MKAGVKVKTIWMARQGDILFRKIEKLPKGKKTLVADGIIAHGEVTGHKHAIADLAAAELLDVGGGRFVRVNADGGVSIVHEEHGTIKLPIGNYKIIRQREYTPEEIRTVAD